jgi:hypothetical protein
VRSERSAASSGKAFVRSGREAATQTAHGPGPMPSVELGLVEHRDQSRPSPVLRSQSRDVCGEIVIAPRGPGGRPGALEDAHGTRVCPPVGFHEHLVGDTVIDGERIARLAGLASLRQPQPQVGVDLIPRGSNRLFPREVLVTIAEQRPNEPRMSLVLSLVRAAARSTSQAPSSSAAVRRAP